jgi:hypothetical protein
VARQAVRPERTARGLPARVPWRRLAWPALFVLLAAGAALLIHETRGTTFWFDEWEFVIDRSGNDPETFLSPHGEHLSLVPIAIYKLLLATAGMDHYLLYRLIVIGLHLLCAALVFVYVRRRVGPLLGLLAATLVVTLGPGWQNFLWPFQMAWLISLAAGLGALMLLERVDRRGDVGASVLLGVSLASSGLGLPIMAGLAVDLGLARRRLRDAWIVLAPLALYVPWWIAYRPAGVIRHQIVLALDFSADSAAAVMNALTGLTQAPLGGPASTLEWGRPLAVAAVALLVWRLVTMARVPARVWALVTIIVSFWVLTGLRRAGLAVGNESRYVYVGVFFALPLIADLARGAALPTRLAPVAVAAVALVAVTNLGDLRDAGRFLRQAATYTRADLAALELGRGRVGDDYVATRMTGYPLIVIRAGRYFRAVDRYGSPAYTPAELATAPEPARRIADGELAKIAGVALVPSAPGGEGAAPTVDAAVGGTAREKGSCVTFTPAPVAAPGAATELQLTVPAGGLAVTAHDAPLTVGVRRFAAGFDRQPLGRLAAGATATLRIAADSVPQPWHAQIVPQGRVTACGLGTAR